MSFRLQMLAQKVAVAVPPAFPPAASGRSALAYLALRAVHART